MILVFDDGRAKPFALPRESGRVTPIEPLSHLADPKSGANREPERLSGVEYFAEPFIAPETDRISAGIGERVEEPGIVDARSSDKVRLPLAQKPKSARLTVKSHLRRLRPTKETISQQRCSKDKAQAGGESSRCHVPFLFGIRRKGEGIGDRQRPFRRH